MNEEKKTRMLFVSMLVLGLLILIFSIGSAIWYMSQPQASMVGIGVRLLGVTLSVPFIGIGYGGLPDQWKLIARFDSWIHRKLTPAGWLILTVIVVLPLIVIWFIQLIKALNKLNL